MTPFRPLSRRLAVTGSLTGGLIAGLAVTAPLLAVAEPSAQPRHPASRSVVAHAVVHPTSLTPRPAHRASRSARAALPAPGTALRTVAAGRSFEGLASWYGGSFHGRRTASGERYDAEGLTAASRTLPFGTRLRVCRDQRCVVVRVNDRGPFVDSRVLDLSHGASRALGFSGVVHVTATPVETRRVAVHRRTTTRHQPVRRPARPVVPVPVEQRPAAAALDGQEASSLGVLAAGLVATYGVALTPRRGRGTDLQTDEGGPS